MHNYQQLNVNNKLSKQPEQEWKHRHGDHLGGYQLGGRRGSGEKGTGTKKYTLTGTKYTGGMLRTI